MQYTLVLNPSHNRVYAAQAPQLALAELACLNHALGGKMEKLESSTLGGAPCLTWEQTEEASPLAIRWLGRLSSSLLLLKTAAQGYTPVPLSRLQPQQEDLVTIPKYQGRTNEQFTRLMLNAVLLYTPYWDLPARNIQVLDPMCGRGTTLLEALVQGHAASGIEIDKKETEWYKTYLANYLKFNRYKHQVTQENITDHRGAIGQRYSFTFAPDKETLKETPQHCQMVRGDTLLGKRFFPKESFHVLAADLPYGVQHGAAQGSSLSRKPQELMEAALPVWHTLLKPQGAMALAYNTRTLSPDTLAALAEKSGFQVIRPEAYSFNHRVDASIQRDLLLAVKPNEEAIHEV